MRLSQTLGLQELIKTDRVDKTVCSHLEHNHQIFDRRNYNDLKLIHV